jgi:pyridoxal phosphate enzyme (YggS family)
VTDQGNSSDMQSRIDAILLRMASACARAGRAVEDVRLIAVSKTYPPDSVNEAAACGLSVFGESRVYEAEAKISLCPGHVEWEFIGHLQRNKVRQAVTLFRKIHAVDSLALLNKINSSAELLGSTVSVCLEINVSGEASKYGLAPEGVPDVLEAATNLLHVDVIGVMTIPPFSPDAEQARPYFRKLRELRDSWSAQSGFALSELSMGMSGDFEVAIEEGATCIRVGTAIFGSRV